MLSTELNRVLLEYHPFPPVSPRAEGTLSELMSYLGRNSRCVDKSTLFMGMHLRWAME